MGCFSTGVLLSLLISHFKQFVKSITTTRHLSNVISYCEAVHCEHFKTVISLEGMLRTFALGCLIMKKYVLLFIHYVLKQYISQTISHKHEFLKGLYDDKKPGQLAQVVQGWTKGGACGRCTFFRHLQAQMSHAIFHGTSYYMVMVVTCHVTTCYMVLAGI